MLTTKSRLESEKWEIKHKQHLRSEYEPYIISAGYKPELVAKLTAEDVFLLATAVRNAVKDAAWEMRTFVAEPPFELCGVLQHITTEVPNYAAALAALSPVQKENLRERINYVPMRRRP